MCDNFVLWRIWRKSVSGKNGAVVGGMGLAEFRRHCERVVKVGEGTIGIKRARVEDCLSGLSDYLTRRRGGRGDVFQLCRTCRTFFNVASVANIASTNVAISQLGIGLGNWQYFHILTAVALAKVVGNISTPQLGIGIGYWQHWHILTAVALAKVVGNISTPQLGIGIGYWVLVIGNISTPQLGIGIGYWQHFHIGNIQDYRCLKIDASEGTKLCVEFWKYAILFGHLS